VPPRGETVGAPATETEPDRPLKPWLETAFRGLVSHDPPTAGRLLIGLLPAQGLAHPEPIAYDLRLGAEDYVHVTVADEPPLTTVTRASEPRPRDELQFWAEGDPATLARAAAAGGLRRRFGRRRLRISGGRGGFDAVRGIVRLRRSLDELVDCGVRLDPELTFLLVAWTIDPQWTHHERFTIAHAAAEDAAPTYLHVRRGERATVSSAAPLWDVATTIICADDALLGALAGRRGPEIAVRGDDGALATVTSWLDNAQWR
jgi:hypothetical protein